MEGLKRLSEAEQHNPFQQPHHFLKSIFKWISDIAIHNFLVCFPWKEGWGPALVCSPKRHENRNSTIRAQTLNMHVVKIREDTNVHTASNYKLTTIRVLMVLHSEKSKNPRERLILTKVMYTRLICIHAP